LIHAGDGYLKSNLRYHVYYDHVDVHRTENETNPLPMRFGRARAKMFVR